MVIGLIRPLGSTATGQLGSGSWRGSNSTPQQISDPGSSKDPVVRLSQMLGQISLVAEQQHSLKKCLELATAEALAEFDSVGYLESLAVCLDEARALERHKERRESAFTAFDAALARHHSFIATGDEQEQVAAAKARLISELSAVAAEAVQQVRAAAAAAAARKQAVAGSMSKEQEQTAESMFDGFKAQLQVVEDDCADVKAAQQACKEAVAQHLSVKKAQTAATNSTCTANSSSSARSSVCNPAALLFKGQLEAHAQQVLTAVKHRAAALRFEAKQATSHTQQHTHTSPKQAAVVAKDTWWQQADHTGLQAIAGSHTNMLQHAHKQRAERVMADKQQLQAAVQRAVQLMQQQVAQLEDKGWQNVFMAGKLVEGIAHKAHAEFIKLAGRQHSFAPGSADYHKQLAAVEAEISSSKEQFLDKVQVAASRTATAAAAAVDK